MSGKKFATAKQAQNFAESELQAPEKDFSGFQRNPPTLQIYILAFGSGLLKPSALQRGSRFRKKLKQTKIRATGPQGITTAGRWLAK
jgi:hypothetical protein